MARTPADNIATLKAYWAKLTLGGGELIDLANAQRAMRELIWDAQNSWPVRRQFSEASIFEMALNWDKRGDSLVGAMRKAKAIPLIGGNLPSYADTKSVREIMLNGITAVATGTLKFWDKTQDPLGVTTWLNSAAVSKNLMANTMRLDPDPAVRAAALTLVRDVAIPQSWTTWVDERLFEGIGEALISSALDTKTRAGLRTLTLDAQASIRRSSEKLPNLSVVVGGDSSGGGGTTVTVTAPPAHVRTPWYKNGPVIAVGLLAFVGGALYPRIQRLRN